MASTAATSIFFCADKTELMKSVYVYFMASIGTFRCSKCLGCIDKSVGASYPIQKFFYSILLVGNIAANLRDGYNEGVTII